MSRVGNLSVSTHVSTPASCGSGTVHLSACVSARLAVWHPLLPTLPDFEREQSHYFSHGDEAQPLIYPPTHSHWRVLQGTESPPDKRMRFLFHGFSVRVFTIHTIHNEESLQHKKKRQTHAAITTHPNTEIGDLQPSLSSEEQKCLERTGEKVNRKRKTYQSDLM